MSHQVTIKAQIKNLVTLKTALEQLGYSYEENGRLSDYQSHKLGTVDLLVSTGKHTNRVGFKLDESGEEYNLVGDFYQTGVAENKFRNAVKKTYVALEIKALVRRKRYTVIKEEQTAKGAIKIRARAMAA
jgi:hypothetical protein